MAPSGPPAAKATAAAPKAKADAKPKAKKVVKDDGEADKNRMEAPNFEAHQEKVAKVQEVIDKIQKEVAAITAKVQERSAGKEDFFSQKAVIRAELDEVSGHMNKIQEQKEAISKMLGDRSAEGAEMKQAVSKMKKTIGFTSEAEIDDRIATIEYKLVTTSVSLKEEKAFIAEIKELKKNKPKVSQVSQMEGKLADFKNESGASLKEQRNELNEKMAQFREQKKGIQERLMALTEARKAQMGDMGDVMEKRQELQKKIQEKIAERSALRDEFTAEKRKFSEYLGEQRRIKQEKYQEDQKARQAEWKVTQLQKKVEALDEQPHVSEITLIEQTIKFCKSLMPQEVVTKTEEAKTTEHNTKDGEMVLASKESRDAEFYYVPTKKAKSGKKAKGAGAGDVSKKPIKHNAETFKLFDNLKLDAPITTADIPALLEKLDAQMVMYQQKVKDWEENREALKAKILSGEVDIEEEKKEEEKAKEEEKEEEKEEAKEDEKDAEK